MNLLGILRNSPKFAQECKKFGKLGLKRLNYENWKVEKGSQSVIWLLSFALQRLTEDLDSYDAPINQVRDTTNSMMEKHLVDGQTFKTIQNKSRALIERQQQLKKACKEKEDR